ncbi:MAG: amidohydrolase family protein [Bryobacterales bacterium]|nr:amidohydrolase family protein [Bryobacterales bacterium]
MRIDTQISLWKETPDCARKHPRFPGEDRAFLPEHIEPILARNRFDGGLLVSTGGEAAEIAQLAAWCKESRLLHGLVLAWVAQTESAPELEEWGGVLRGYWARAGSTAIAEAAAHCERNGLALDIAPAANGFHLRSLAEIARTNSNTPLVLAHAGAPPLGHGELAHWMEEMRALAREPNVHVKLSGFWSTSLDEWNLATLQSLVGFLLEQFGERRLLFGSDWPFCLPAHSWKECLARFTQAIGARKMSFRELLLGDNAARVYGLPASLGEANSAGSSLP